MALPPLKLNESIDRFKENEPRADAFINGGEDDDWFTSDGARVPSLRKFQKTTQDTVDAILPTALAAADRAETFGPRVKNSISAFTSDSSLTTVNTPPGSGVHIIGYGDYLAVDDGGQLINNEGVRVEITQADMTSANPAGNAYNSRDSYNPSPTDDTLRVRAVIGKSAVKRSVDLRGDKLGMSISEGVAYTNAGLDLEGGRDSALVARAGATFDAMLYPAAWLSDAANFPDNAYDDKFRRSIRGLSLDGNISNGASVEYGIVSVPYAAVDRDIKIKNISGIGYALLSRNKHDTASVIGNNILNYMDNISVENPLDSPMSIGYLLGEDYNGKITDGVAFGVHSFATELAVKIGSAQGWMWNFGRHAKTDDGIVFKHANRTSVVETIIDEFGEGYNPAKTSFVGVDLGRLTNVDAANTRLRGGTILSRAGAGDTTGISYVGVQFGASGLTAKGRFVQISDTHIHLSGSDADTTALKQSSDSGNTNLSGIIHDVSVSGDYAGDKVKTLFDVLSPNVMGHHVQHGKDLKFFSLNERGHHNLNTDRFLLSRDNEAADLTTSKISIPVSTPTAFAAVDVGTNGGVRIDIDIVAQNAEGHIVCSGVWSLVAQRHTTASAPMFSAPTNRLPVTFISNSDTLRKFDSLSITAAGSSDGRITFSVSATTSGSNAPSQYQIVATVKAFGMSGLSPLNVIAL